MAKAGGGGGANKDNAAGVYESGADPRLDFICEYLTRSLKIKMDKWLKFVMTEEYRNVMNDFFDIAEFPVS